MRIKK